VTGGRCVGEGTPTVEERGTLWNINLDSKKLEALVLCAVTLGSHQQVHSGCLLCDACNKHVLIRCSELFRGGEIVAEVEGRIIFK
jgi:hypothetical protein